ncbi:flagellar export chaperone FliS [Pelotomaculum propionicicum]|uniref:flagellar export chaperone FliS n=1 Tax=Pelotomaculum propionicicum TaxID=258475 RepID=UPI003B7E4F00
MYNCNPYQQYKQNSVISAGKGELTLILYDGAVKFIKQGIKHLEEGKIQDVHNAILKAQEIITHLSETLNMEYEISGNLSSLYEYINRRLFEANMKKDKYILGEALGLVVDLRDTWREAVKIAKPLIACGQ